jgi:hypothetical protein
MSFLFETVKEWSLRSSSSGNFFFESVKERILSIIILSFAILSAFLGSQLKHPLQIEIGKKLSAF